MKTFKLVLVLAFALAMSFCASAQHLPIGSEDSLRNYALGKVVRGYRWVESPSIGTIPGSPLHAIVEGDGAEDVLNKLMAQEIMYTIGNPEDQITSHLYLYDESGNALFQGWAQYGLDEINGKGGGPSYSLWMQNIPLGVSVASAEILVFDEDGRTQHVMQVQVRDGRLLFQPHLAGAPNGLLVVQLQDGTVVTYRLSDPRPTSPELALDADAAYQIPGHHVYHQTRDESIYIDFVEVYHLPTVYLEFRKEQQVVVDVQGLLQKNGATFVERPSGLYFETADGQGGYVALNTDSATTVRFPRDGKLRFRFVWVEFGQPNTIYIPTPDEGGGRG